MIRVLTNYAIRTGIRRESAAGRNENAVLGGRNSLGDPDICNAAPNRRDRAPFAPLPDEVDVLIAGCGPAGLWLAAHLPRFPEIGALIVERKPGQMEKGQADGLNTRTMEMVQASSFAETVESCWVDQTTFWTPAP